MRDRSHSGVRLDFYQRVISKTILQYQNSVTGLLPATPNHPHGWIRDNVYSILSVWGLALAYRKTADLDEDRAKAYELEQSVVKLMRGILSCLMGQIDKVEKFKHSQSTKDSLHAKFSVETGATVVGDDEWGHLQIDAISLFMLTLAQMTASGLQIIYNLDEVAFIQNLVYYIHMAYRTPDYGIWERGDKTNNGAVELNATSIGMAKAALDALNELDLFGANGGASSFIHVMSDEAQQCNATLTSMLPRESNSKETDAGLLSVISYPAFAIDDPDLIERTRDNIVKKLMGNYGLRRFLRDGYKTPKEDPNRLHYEVWELQEFENIECEWPMFFAYLALDAIFNGKKDEANEFINKLEDLMIKREDGVRIMPELYAVHHDQIDEERNNPRSTSRSYLGKVPHMWGQSLYVLAKLLLEKFLSPGEIDPLNRRLCADPKPDLVVQVVIVAESDAIQEKLRQYDVKVETIANVSDIQIFPARVLSYIFSHLGSREKLGLTGRPSDALGVLATSQLYSLGDKLLAFMPQGFDQTQFYLPLDVPWLLDGVNADIQYLGDNWTTLGRPLTVIPITSDHLDMGRTLHPALVSTIKKLKTGYINGTRVALGNIGDFVSTSCVTNLTFLLEKDDSPRATNLLKYLESMKSIKSKASLLRSTGDTVAGDKVWSRMESFSRKLSMSYKGSIRRTCSIHVDDSSGSDHGSYNTPSFELSTECTPVASVTTSPTPCNDEPFFINFSYPHNQDSGFHINYQYSGADVEDLVHQLQGATSLHEQADIIHCLYTQKGLDWVVGIHGRNGTTVQDLILELYEKAGQAKQWWLIRHTAGSLKKRVEYLAKAVTDILVRQKQLAVGLPPEPREKIITKPCSTEDIASIIHEACGDDSSTAMLTQEILVYLAMFIRTEPKLFVHMLRLRVGLIIQVMASELARTMNCSGEEASDQLLNLSPYEVKMLLHHILSGKEFNANQNMTKIDYSIQSASDIITGLDMNKNERRKSFACNLMVPQKETFRKLSSQPSKTSLNLDLESDQHGQWERRRRLDGALNRVPVGFYEDMWKLLRRCHGIHVGNELLSPSLTKEMTSGELKFALQVEKILNSIPQPEYRQLMVEGLMIFCLIISNDHGQIRWNHSINMNEVVKVANEIFLAEQVCLGDTSLLDPVKGAADISIDFYDTAPSGRYGTMSYLGKAVVKLLHFPTTGEGNLDCTVS